MKSMRAVIFCVTLIFSVGAVAEAAQRKHRRPVAAPRADEVEQEGYTPLMRAAQRGQAGVVRALLKKGAEVDAPHLAGFTALMVAAEKGHLRVVRILLAAGADPNVRVYTSHGGEVSPLTWAVLSGKKEIVEVLLKAGAQADPPATEGGTPLMWAVASSETDIVRMLLSAGANVNARMPNGYTALMSAAGKSEPEIAQILIAAGAEVNAKNNFGETALSIAAKSGVGKEQIEALVSILKKAGAKE